MFGWIENLYKQQTTLGLRNAVRLVLQEFRTCRNHKRSVREVKGLVEQDLKLHLGCGKQLKPGWLNIDANNEAELQLDLREKNPFPDNSVAVIYSEHFLEHLEYPVQARYFLQESLRVLKPNGLFSVGVPDTEWPLRSYGGDDKEYFEVASKYWHPEWCNTELHSINHHFRQNSQHKYAYDYETLEKVLYEAGFVAVKRREFDPDLDSEHRKLGTLYVEAYKPTSKEL